MKTGPFLSPLVVLGLVSGFVLAEYIAQAQTISQPPLSRTNAVGTTATFSVTAEGAEPLAYQWQFNGTNLTDGGRISGSATRILTLSYVQSHHAGRYSVLVADGTGGVVNSEADLTVFLPPPGGTLDNSFTIPGSLSAINTPVRCVLVQPDGRILIGGEFTYTAGVTRQFFMRLDGSGVLDPGLAAPNGPVFCMALQDDGKVIIAGGFISVSGVSINHLARLNTDGTLDASFQSGLVRADGLVEGPVGGIAVQADGKVVVGGTFSSVHGVMRNNVARLHPDGTLDASFQDGLAGIAGSAGPVLVQPDGRVLVGGKFSKVNGVARSGIARLHPDGTLDDTFMNGLGGTEAGASVFCMALQPDGKVLIGGTFRRLNGLSQSGIGRLNPDGTLDAFFEGEASGWVHAMVLQPDGRIVIGGQFSGVNGVARTLIARLDPNGTLDSTFEALVSGDVYPKVMALAVDGDGRVILGGGFTSVGGQPAPNVARVWGGPVLQSPLITSQPTGQDLLSGLPASFAVTAIGDPPLAYQWRKNGTNLVDDGRVTGVTSRTLTLSTLQPSDSGNFTVVITNIWGGATSTPPAVLTVDSAPRIVGQPVTQSVSPRATAKFSVFATGYGPFRFAWFKDGVPMVEGGRWIGTQTSTLAIHNAATSDAGQYRVTVSNAKGESLSAPAVLHVPPYRFVGNLASSGGLARRVALSGNFAYLANTRDPSNFNPGSLDIIDISDPVHPVRRGRFHAANDVYAVAVAGDRACLARAYAEPMGLSILDINNPAAPVLLGHYGSYATSSHGTDVAVGGGRAYLAAGAALRVVDISTPAHPLVVGGWTNVYGSEEVEVSGDFAYYGSSGLHVIRVDDPAHCVRVSGPLPGSLGGVALSGNRVYSYGSLGLRIYDASNPSNVVRLSSLDLGQISDMVVRGQMAYAAGGDNGLRLLDVSDPANPVSMGECPTLGTAQGVAVSGGFAYVADGGAGLSVYSLGEDLAPDLLEQPQPQVATIGTSAFFTIAANGTAPLRHQWWFGDELLDGATNTTLWLTNVQPTQAGAYSVVVTNHLGRVTSEGAALIVRVPPRLDISWAGGLPRLSLTGVAGDAYALEHAPELLWLQAWLTLTNVSLTTPTLESTDTTATEASQRYYRARLLDYAPDFLAGKTVVATVTNFGPIVVTLAYDASTFTQIGTDPQSGTYTYTKTGPATARIDDVTTAPPEFAGTISETRLTFTRPNAGTFVSQSVRADDDSDIAYGTFLIHSSP